jgi:hypothetical protein
MTYEREATLVGQVKEPERPVNRTGHLVHFERTPWPWAAGMPLSSQAPILELNDHYQGETWIVDSPEGVWAGQARYEYPA